MDDTMTLMQGYLQSRAKSLSNLEKKEHNLINQLKNTQQLHNSMLQQQYMRKKRQSQDAKLKADPLMFEIEEFDWLESI